VWHFQFVKHDVWDRDLPAAPSLVRVRRNGKWIDAVAQITKSGHVWVFDRETGKSLYPYKEVSVPASELDGEVLATKQVLPLKPEPFARQQVSEETLTQRTPEANKAVRSTYRRLKNGPQFTPPSREGSIIFPGLDGGGEWGGGSWDPETGLFYVNSNEMAWILRLVPRVAASGSAKSLYMANCSGCHKPNLQGTPPEFPSLVNVYDRRKPEHIAQTVRQGAGRMPGYAYLGDAAVTGLLKYIQTGEDVQVAGPVRKPSNDLKYRLDGYIRYEDPDKYPAIAPPWGTLNAIDLSTGNYKWKIPFGEIPALVEKGIRNTGSENYGGGVVTAGGLLFIGATNYDRKFRAYDKLTGKLLWEAELPAGGNATPATYEINGEQYVVIGAGGGKWNNPSGGSYLAYKLGR
jgi:quinoprotein glucose dehydrogenase